MDAEKDGKAEQNEGFDMVFQSNFASPRPNRNYDTYDIKCLIEQAFEYWSEFMWFQVVMLL